MIKPNIKGSWRKDPDGIYRVYIKGTIQYDGTVVEVESRSGNSKIVTVTGTHSKVTGGYLYWYKPVETTTEQTVIAIGVPTTSDSYSTGPTAKELDAALGF